MRDVTEPSLKEFAILLGHNTHRRLNKGIIQDFIMKGKMQGPEDIFQIYLFIYRRSSQTF